MTEVLNTLRDPNHRVRQPFVNCLLLAYGSGSTQTKLRSAFESSPLLLENVLTILDRAPLILRGKLYLLLGYIFNCGNGSLLHRAAQLRLFIVLSHDSKKALPEADINTHVQAEHGYMIHCTHCFLYVIADAVPRWMAELESTLRVTAQRKRPPPQQLKDLRRHLNNLPGIADALASPLVRSYVQSPPRDPLVVL